MFLKSIHYFRGLAIVVIVAGHSYALADWDIDTSFDKFWANLLSGGSVFFVFISGFLFHHIFSRKFNYVKFMSTKLKKVFLPYLLLTTPPLLYLIYVKGAGPHSFTDNNFVAALFYFATGRAMTAYWYVPFIMIVFLLSPAFRRFISYDGQGVLICLLFVVAAFIHRPVDNINILQATLYFTPVYLLGIWSSINKEKIYQVFLAKEYVFLVPALMLALLQAVFYENVGNFHKDAFTFEAFDFSLIDINLFQKVLLCFFFMIFLRRFEDTEINTADLLARLSFPIYFIHPFIIKTMEKAGVTLPGGVPGATVLIIAASMFVGAGALKVLALQTSAQLRPEP